MKTITDEQYVEQIYDNYINKSIEQIVETLATYKTFLNISRAKNVLSRTKRSSMIVGIPMFRNRDDRVHKFIAYHNINKNEVEDALTLKIIEGLNKKGYATVLGESEVACIWEESKFWRKFLILKYKIRMYIDSKRIVCHSLID